MLNVERITTISPKADGNVLTVERSPRQCGVEMEQVIICAMHVDCFIKSTGRIDLHSDHLDDW